jgi:tetratricopeptide (TPR) repeat protein
MALPLSKAQPQILVDIFQPDDAGPFVIEVSDPLLPGEKVVCTHQLPADYSSAQYGSVAKLLDQSRALGGAPTAGTTWKNTQRYRDLVRFGRKLYNDLFGSNNTFAGHVARARHLQDGFQLQIRLSNSATELWNIPWEYAHDGEKFVVYERGWLLNRWLRDVEMEIDNMPIRAEPRPLGVLVVMSDPVDAAPLNIEQEVAYIKTALGAAERRGLIVVDFVEESTLRNLDLALGEREYHVLHYSGRGLSTGRGSCLVMEDEEGNSVPAYAHDLMDIIREHKSLRLVLLNACRAGLLEEAIAVTDIATGLLTLLPAVVIMQFAVQDRTAFEFSRAFYGELVMGSTLEEAVHSGRMAMIRQYERFMDWGIPALYTQRANLRLINPDTPPVPRPDPGYNLETLPRPRVFVGRRAEQRRLRAVLPLLKISAAFVWGMPGIGKSALVRRLIERPGRTGIVNDVLVIDCSVTSPRELLSQLAVWLSRHFPAAEDVLLNPLFTPELKIFEAAKIVKRQRFILVLDRFDSLMMLDESGAGTIQNKQLNDFFGILASAPWSVLTIFTSRLYWNAIPELREGSTVSLHMRELGPGEVHHLFGQLEHLRLILPDGLDRLIGSVGGHLSTLHLIDAAVARDPARAQKVDESFIRSLLNRLTGDWLGDMLSGLTNAEIDMLTVLSLLKTGFWSAHVRYLADQTDFQTAESLMVRWELRSVIYYLHDGQDGEPWYTVAAVVASMLRNRQPDERIQALHRPAAEAGQHALFDSALRARESGKQIEIIPDDVFGTACDYLRYIVSRAAIPVREQIIARALDWRKHWMAVEEYDKASAIVDIVWLEMVNTFGQINEAHVLLSQSLKTAKGIEGLHARASVANLNERQGRAEQALEQYAALAASYAKIGDVKNQAAMLSSQGRIWAERDLKQAIRLETEALQLRKQNESLTGMAESYRTLASYLQREGNNDVAFNMIEQAAYYAQRSANPSVNAAVQLARGQLRAHMKVFDEAFKHLQNAIELAQSSGDINIHITAVSEIGEIHRIHHSYDQAAQAFIEAVELCEVLGDRHSLTLHLFRLALAYFGMWNFDDAKRIADRAMESARSHRPELAAEILRLMRLIKKTH